jgi:N-acetylmuramoyl-L-alanine amidase
MTDTDLVAALSPIQRVGLTLWAEARGSSKGLRLAIASVILNRVKAQHHAWGLTADDVCLKPKQFSCWNQGPDHNHQALLDAARHLLRGDPIGPILKECLAIAAEVCTGTLADCAHGATFYYSPASMVPPGRVPSWAIGLSPVAIVDATHFYVSF